MWAGSTWACEHQEVEITEGQRRGWLTTSSLETLDVFVQYTYHLAMVPTPFYASSHEERPFSDSLPSKVLDITQIQPTSCYLGGRRKGSNSSSSSRGGWQERQRMVFFGVWPGSASLCQSLAVGWGQRWFQQGSRSFLTSCWQQQHLKLQVLACAYDLTTYWQLPNFQFFQTFQQLYKHAIHIIL